MRTIHVFYLMMLWDNKKKNHLTFQPTTISIYQIFYTYSTIISSQGQFNHGITFEIIIYSQYYRNN